MTQKKPPKNRRLTEMKNMLQAFPGCSGWRIFQNNTLLF